MKNKVENKNLTDNNEKPMLGEVVCPNCGEKHNYRQITVSMIEHIENEKARICNKCGALMDYWSFGFWESNLD